MAESADFDIPLTSDWINLTTLYPAITSVSGWVQNTGNTKIRVRFTASATKPLGGGNPLGPNDMAYGTAANVWAKSVGGSGSCTVGLTD